MLEYGILGPLAAWVDGAPVDLGGARIRAVLGVLLLGRNTVVSVDRLVDAVWGEDPPPTAETALQNHVSRLRRLLGADAIATRAPGYVLRTGPGAVDVERFEALTERARGAGPREAGALLREALGLWRGPALADLAYESFAEVEIARLEELRLGALEARIESDLAAGRHETLAGELEALTAEHPYRERLWGQRILALYRSGRQAEALAAYQRARGALDEGLGIDPGPDLQALEVRILQQDPTLAAPVVGPEEGGGTGAGPGVGGAPSGDMAPDATVAPGPPVEPAPRHPWSATSPGLVRKTVTLVFVDVTYSAPGGASLDPEMIRSLVVREQGLVAELVTRHGGTVERRAGDVAMAVFGLPSVHEDDALRAVRAADEMRAALAGLGSEIEAQRGVTLRTRIGVDTGEVVTGGEAGGALVTGEAVALGLGLGRAAAAGEVLLGASTFRLVRDAVVAEAVEPTPVQRLEGRVAAYRLRSVTPGADPLARRQDTLLVGRDRELARLDDTFEDIVARQQCHVFTVLGAAGIGKTRLVAELARHIPTDALLLRGRCLPYGDGITFWPLRTMIADAAGFSDRDGADAARSRIASLLSATPDGGLVAERLCQAVGLSSDPTPVEELFWAVRRLFASLATGRPVVVVFDDLQWAEPTLLDLVDELADQTRDVPVLIVCLARPELLERRPTWGGGRVNATTVLLDALTPSASERLLADLTGEDPLPATLRDRLVAAAEGNPLFLQELVAGLLDDGRLRCGPAGWVIAGDVDRMVVPPTIAALMAARLDHLGQEERMVIGHASVAGRTFELDALLELVPGAPPPAIDVALRALVRAGLLRPEAGNDGGPAYRFRHLVTRDLSYAGLPKELRASLHERFAAWIAARRSDRIEEFEEILGYHLEQACAYREQLGTSAVAIAPQAERAAGWLASAGRRAMARQDVPAAESLLTRAAALLPPSGEPHLELQLFLAELRRQRGDLAGAGAALVRVRNAAGAEAHDGIADRAAVLLAWLHGSTAPRAWLHEAEEVTRAAEPRLSRAGDDEGLALLWGLRMDAAVASGRVSAARTAAGKAISHGERSGDAWQITRRARSILAELSVVDDTPITEAEPRCVALLDAVGQERRLEASILFALARLQAMRGDDDRACSSVTRGRMIAAELGLLYGRLSGEETAAFLAITRGDLTEAGDALRGAVEVVVEHGDHRAAIRLSTQLAEVRARQGNDSEAAALVTGLRARPDAEAAEVETRAVLAGVAAILAARSGDATGARALASDAVRAAEDSESPVWLAHALALASEAVADLDAVASSRYRARAIELYARKGASRLAARLLQP